MNKLILIISLLLLPLVTSGGEVRLVELVDTDGLGDLHQVTFYLSVPEGESILAITAEEKQGYRAVFPGDKFREERPGLWEVRGDFTSPRSEEELRELAGTLRVKLGKIRTHGERHEISLTEESVIQTTEGEVRVTPTPPSAFFRKLEKDEKAVTMIFRFIPRHIAFYHGDKLLTSKLAGMASSDIDSPRNFRLEMTYILQCTEDKITLAMDKVEDAHEESLSFSCDLTPRKTYRLVDIGEPDILVRIRPDSEEKLGTHEWILHFQTPTDSAMSANCKAVTMQHGNEEKQFRMITWGASVNVNLYTASFYVTPPKGWKEMTIKGTLNLEFLSKLPFSEAVEISQGEDRELTIDGRRVRMIWLNEDNMPDDIKPPYPTSQRLGPMLALHSADEIGEIELTDGASMLEIQERIPRTRGWKMPEEGADKVSYYELPVNAPEKLKLRLRFCERHTESLPISRRVKVRD